MAIQVHKAGIRKALPPRREPFWARMSRGRFIGYRKLEDGTGTWIARRRSEDGGQQYKALGFESASLGFDEAKAKAEAWFKLKDMDIKDDVVTVSDACRRYVEERRTSKSESCANDAHRRFERTIYGRRHPKTDAVLIPESALGKRHLTKLRTAHFKQWRDALSLAPAAFNRTLTAVKAALNLAVQERNVVASQAQEWRELKRLPSKPRAQVFLDLQQRQAFVGSASGGARDLIYAATVTGARPGELVKATREQFEARTKSMKFVGKTGEREIPLSPAAFALFERLSKDKLPKARLLVRDDGTPWGHSDWDELIKEAAQKAGLPDRTTLYSCRHSWITQQLLDGTPSLEVAKLSGTSLAMIEKHYGHLVASVARERLALVKMI